MRLLFQLKEGALSNKCPICCFGQEPYEFLWFQSCTDQKKHGPCGSWPTATIHVAEPQTHILRAVPLQTRSLPVLKLWAEKSWVGQCHGTPLARAELWVRLLQTGVSPGAAGKLLPKVHVVEGRAGSPSAHVVMVNSCPWVSLGLGIVPGPLRASWWDASFIQWGLGWESHSSSPDGGRRFRWLVGWRFMAYLFNFGEVGQDSEAQCALHVCPLQLMSVTGA